MIGPLFKFALPLLGASLAFACGTEGGSENEAEPGGGAATGGQSSSGGGGGASGGTDSGGEGATGGDPGTGGASAAGTGGTSASGATGGEGGSDDGGAAGAGGDETADFDFDYNAPVEEYDPCANTNVPALPVPVDMYIILDSSGSMSGTKWTNAKKALNNFFSDPAMAGNGVALQDFDSTGCSALSTPAVAMQDLPSHTSQLSSALNGWSASGGTEMEGALRGLVSYTGNRQGNVPDRIHVGILITDGQPEGGCNNNTGTLASIVTNHYNNTNPQIATYMVGMTGANFGTLNSLAAGAAPAPLNVVHNVGNGSGSVLTDVLKTIQAASVECMFQIPTSASGAVDMSTLKAKIVAGNGSETPLLPRGTSAAACAGGEGYYLNAAPQFATQLLLCDASCDIMKADPAARVDITLECTGG